MKETREREAEKKGGEQISSKTNAKKKNFTTTTQHTII